MKRAPAWFIAAVLAAPARPAAAAACDSILPEAGAPVRVPLGPAALGTIPEACRANEASLQTSVAALVASEDFYGYLHVVAAPRVRWTLPGGPWLSVWVPGFGYWFAANATVEADLVELESAALGLHVPLDALAGDALRVTPYVRLLSPSTAGYVNATRYGFDHGVSAAFSVAPRLELTGGFSFPALLTANGSTVHASAVPGAALDAVWAPWRWLGVVGGFGARVRLGPDHGFAAADLRAALRAYALEGLRLELGAIAPLGGNDRTDAVLAFSVGWVRTAEPR